MPIEQWRLYGLLCAAEDFERLYTGTVAQAQHLYARVIKIRQSGAPVPDRMWESTFMDLFQTLQVLSHTPQSVLLAKERAAYDFTAKSNEKDRLRQERRRREKGVQARPRKTSVGSMTGGYMHGEQRRLLNQMKEIDDGDEALQAMNEMMAPAVPLVEVPIENAEIGLPPPHRRVYLDEIIKRDYEKMKAEEEAALAQESTDQ